MGFLMRLLSVVIFVGWAGYSYAYEVEISWQPKGEGMQLTVVSVNAYWNPNKTVNCGAIASCYVKLAGGSLSHGATFYYDFPKMSYSGQQGMKKIVDAWGATSPSVYINNWEDMVNKIGAAPCFQFEIRGATGGGTFGSTCAGSATPPPPPKPPEPQISCYLSGNIYLQHGSLADSEVAGSQASTTARVYCTGTAKVKVRALSSIGSDNYMVNLRSDGSLQSLLTVNGVVGNGNGVLLDIPGLSGRDVVFSSMLITSGTPTPGGFSGSAVAVVDII